MIRVKFGTILFNSRPSALVGPPNEKRLRKAPWWTELLTFKVETSIGTHKMRWKTWTPSSCLYKFGSGLDAVWSFFCVEDLRVKDLLGMCLSTKNGSKGFFRYCGGYPCSLQSSNHSNWCRVLYTNDTTTSMVKICLTWTNPVTARKSRDINTKYMYDDSNMKRFSNINNPCQFLHAETSHDCIHCELWVVATRTSKQRHTRDLLNSILL